MRRVDFVSRLVASRRKLPIEGLPDPRLVQAEAEGGCGVIGIASSEPIRGRHLLQSLIQMRNRGNGKGGGVALAGLDPADFGVDPKLLAQDYLLTVAYLDEEARAGIESAHITSAFKVDHVKELRPSEVEGLESPPPLAICYFIRPLPEALERFKEQNGFQSAEQGAVQDEFVYQNSFRLNSAHYASLGDKEAFVLSHGKDVLVLKMVGYGDDVIRAYGLEETKAHVWIGHHRYPTKGKVWHPGGAHPFVGLHEALVHNGDFANYASVCTYLAQSNIRPLFLTDTEVSVLVFDLLHRVYGYSLEHVIESLAPTTERDFTMLPPEKQDVYRMLQTVHMHGSPDGPWFFLIAQSAPNGATAREARLIGITDTSMLRPQVFALQEGGKGRPSLGFAASEKQAIDAALASMAAEDSRIWTRPDLMWNARGGSHTDGGAFVFRIVRDEGEAPRLICEDKFGREIRVREHGMPPDANGRSASSASSPLALQASPEGLFKTAVEHIPQWSYEDLEAFLRGLSSELLSDSQRALAINTLQLLIDRRYPTGKMRRSAVLSIYDRALKGVFEAIRAHPTEGFAYHERGAAMMEPSDATQRLILDARGFPAEGPDSLALELVRAVRRGWRHLVVAHARGHRFIGNGLGPESEGVRIEVYGSSGDYLASGMDGGEVIVHGSGQDQLAQIMKSGRLVVHGDVGQTFMYAAKGGEVYVLGNAAGRPLINAVGKPKVVINGTCLDYLAESFMAGDPGNGGGFVVVNGVTFDGNGSLQDQETPFPGGNLFSLASGGAIFIRDPRRELGEDQLNGGKFVPFENDHWQLIKPLLEENERLFGISLEWLLSIDGQPAEPREVYRAIYPSGHRVLLPEEAWVAH